MGRIEERKKEEKEKEKEKKEKYRETIDTGCPV